MFTESMLRIKHNPRPSSLIQEQVCVVVFIFICGKCLTDTMVEALLEQLGEISTLYLHHCWSKLWVTSAIELPQNSTWDDWTFFLIALDLDSVASQYVFQKSSNVIISYFRFKLTKANSVAYKSSYVITLFAN